MEICQRNEPVEAGAPALLPYPSKLFVETTTRCNLRCAMCVKQTPDNGVAEGDLDDAVFAGLEPAFARLETLILSGIGEPLLHPRLEEFIRQARSVMPAGATIGFQTNGLLLDEDRALRLVEAGLDRICLSLDAVNPATFRRIREGGEVGALDRAFRALGRAEKVVGRRVEKGIEFVAMRDNVAELPDVVRWAVSRGAAFALVTQVLPYDEHLVQQAAYDPNTDVAVAFFEPWRRRAEAEGIDLDRYFEVLWKYTKSPEDERIVAFVEAMKADAHARDIFVNVQKILERDEAWMDRVGRIFDEAARLASELGLDLRLPEVVPRGDRRCDFVEEGAAFVSWDGAVHPCYFLWHGYRCFINGREKFVRPRVFGRVPEQGILEVWNDPAFRSFRQSVIRYDYPFCSDCNLAKCCDYVQAEEFEQDCYLNAEPCGDCLWCKGVFQCLR
ncbi:radical SAM/SPASM family putative metalloenzyme maturase [Deferrisoma camini]|uniref:radical SAM/SPASM family putative metalloenzyme maturase n=1 Tax=Deferrisoma camini TaxID=1035120 RepID=UPI00046D7517|nr:radical SAM/SPASM family putative metalloenzyme maturase [Deferrisoma camini]